MMIMNWKNDPVKSKPTRFNLGGLFKKKITWRHSIDSLTSSIDHLQLDLNSSANGSASYVGLSANHHEVSLMESTAPDLDSSGTFTEPLSAATSTTSYPPAKNYTHNSAPEERYSSFTTECISLLNSDMTLHMDFNDDDDDDDVDYHHDLSMVAPYRTRSIDYTDAIPYDPKAEETLSDYRPGGYQMVKIGDQYTSKVAKYQVLRKLGWGHFSTVWLCSEVGTGRFVALKIVKLGNNYSEAAKDEIAILWGLQDEECDDVDCPHGLGDGAEVDDHLVKLLDDFVIKGINGVHIAMVFELMGESMLHLMYKHKGTLSTSRSLQKRAPQHLLRLDMVRLIAHQLFVLVDIMHRKGIIHTDLKPENILMTYEGEIPESLHQKVMAPLQFQILPSRPLDSSLEKIETSPLKVKVADLGNATYCNLHFTNHIQTRQYRAPEIILKHRNWGALADVWSVGCLLFELMTGDYLFDPQEGLTFTKDEDHLAQIIELLGEFPTEQYLSECGLASVYFRDTETLENIPTLKFWSLRKVFIEKYKFDFDDDNVKFAWDIILKCLRFDLEERYDCGSLLEHPWFKPNAKYVQHEVDLLPNNNIEIHGFNCEE